MDSTQQTSYGFALPALDPFGGEHFAADGDGASENPAAWIGDPSSVPLPSEGARLEEAGAELDRSIFAALVAP
jgi:hypothetical protein